MFVSIVFLGPKELILFFHSNCQNTFWTRIKCSMKFLILDNIRKSLQLIFFTEIIAFFFSKIRVFKKFLGNTELIL